jgi:hypothetical protein
MSTAPRRTVTVDLDVGIKRPAVGPPAREVLSS